MFLDAQNQFCKALAISASGNATNVIDLSQARNIADGEPMAVIVDFDVAAVGTGTYEVDVVTSASSSLSSPTTVAKSTPAAASLTAGSRIIIPLPPGVAYQQYLGLSFVLGGTSPGTTVTAYLEPQAMVEKLSYYKDNSNIS